jgi:hypothetical protein
MLLHVFQLAALGFLDELGDEDERQQGEAGVQAVSRSGSLATLP